MSIEKPVGRLNSRRKRRIRESLPQVCVKCGATENLTLEHKLALSLGGTNGRDNLEILCSPCNAKKCKTEKLELEKVKPTVTATCRGRKRYRVRPGCWDAIWALSIDNVIPAYCLTCKQYHINPLPNATSNASQETESP